MIQSASTTVRCDVYDMETWKLSHLCIQLTRGNYHYTKTYHLHLANTSALGLALCPGSMKIL